MEFGLLHLLEKLQDRVYIFNILYKYDKFKYIKVKKQNNNIILEDEMKFSQYKYERSSYEDIKDKFIKLVDKINKSTNYEDQKNYILQLNEIRNDIQSNSTIASIRYSIDTSDEYYEEEKKYWDEYMPLYEDLNCEFYKAIVNSQFKNEIINEIEKEYENEKELNEDFESEEKVSLESELKTKKSKSISDLQELIEKTDIKYENNIETLRDYCSDEFIDILENSNDENYSLKDLEQFLEDNKEYFNDKAYIFFEVCVQKQIQKLEQDLLNDICEVKTLKDLKELHDKLLENGEFVKCEDLETIIFRKMETIVKILNLAEINDEENISIANQMYENTSSIELEKYPIAEILICRDINIDLNNVKETIEDLREEVNEIKDTVLKNCMFNCEYYNMNIQINDS